MDTERKLIDILKRKQTELDLSDAEMALRMGVSRELWNQTRREVKPIRAKMLHGIIKGFSELTPECLDFLRQNGTKVSKTGTVLPEERAS